MEADDPVEVTAEAVEPSGPQLVFVTRRHDFGQIWDVDVQSCSFSFVNRGDMELVIEQVKPGCGCTTTTLRETRFLPGEGDTIEVSFAPQGTGRQAKRITVLSNTVDQPVQVLTLIADIMPFITIEPKYLRFGEIQRGETPVMELALDSVDPGFRIDDINIVGAAASFLEVHQAASGRRVTVRFLSESAPWGGNLATLKIACSGTLPGHEFTMGHTVEAGVSAAIYAQLQASDTMYRISIVAPGSSFVRTVRLTRTTGTPFQVTGVTSRAATRSIGAEMPTLAVDAIPVEGSEMTEWDVTLRGDSGIYLGPLQYIITIETDVPGEQRLMMQAAGVVRH